MAAMILINVALRDVDMPPPPTAQDVEATVQRVVRQQFRDFDIVAMNVEVLDEA